MGVYIKNMTIPEKCCMCPLCQEDDLGYIYSYCTGEFKDIPKFGLGEKTRVVSFNRNIYTSWKTD